MAMLLKHFLFIGNNCIFSTWNLVIIMYNQNILLFCIVHSHYLTFPLSLHSK